MLAEKTRRASTNREVRAYEQANEYVVMPKSLEGNDWWVTHRSGRSYVVDLNVHTCTCPDFQKRGGKCKHQHLAQFTADAEAPQQERIETPAPAPRTFSDEERAKLLSLWKGEAAGAESKRERARRLYPLDKCEECGEPAVDRHHKDGDPGNNAPENIARLCRRCHMQADGRLSAMAEVARKRWEKRPASDAPREGAEALPQDHRQEAA